MQSEQTDSAEAAKVAEYFPAGQSVQPTELTDSWYVPAEQLVQIEELATA